MIARTIGRLFIVPIGMLLAGLATGAVLITLGQERLVAALQTGAASDEAMFGLLGLLLKLTLAMFSVQTLLLPLLLVVAGEVARIRHAAYYVGGAGLAFALVPLMARIGAGDGLASLSGVWPVFATAGFAGGFVYWLVAGRNA